MLQGYVAVLDIGKTLSKLSLWSPDGKLVELRTHHNSRALENGYPALDVKGITFWLHQTLAAFAHLVRISAIVPVGHGAAACIVCADGSVVPSLDYEAQPPAEICERYDSMRDSFAMTGSPRLPGGLNLGIQLLWLETLTADKVRSGKILTWPQFWAWQLSGVTATEISSLGCHSDLWVPESSTPSPMAREHGWADRLAPLRHAADVLGPPTARLRDRCHLPEDCAVLCGMHDSNAALWATRGYREIGHRECTVLSTGTWFVAMRSTASGNQIDATCLPVGVDCLLNVDIEGKRVPSARFMGGREVELIEVAGGTRVDVCANRDLLLNVALNMVKNGIFALPTFQKGVGPFPNIAGRWVNRPKDQFGRRAVAGLYLALMTNRSLDLIGSKGVVVIEGRFAEDAVFTRFLATLRPNQSVYVSDTKYSVPNGALRLVDPSHLPTNALVRVEPLACNAKRYASDWLSQIANGSELVLLKDTSN